MADTTAGGGAARGRLVAIEGIDQSGKQTQVERLVERLRAGGVPARAFGFPAYGTPIGRLLHAFLAGGAEVGLEARQMLFAANRWELAPAISAALAAGEVVVIDRYSASGLAYGLAQGLELPWLEALEQGLPRADLVALLDVDPAVAFERKRRARDRYEGQQELLARSRTAYRDLAARDGWLVLDATQPVDQIAERLFTAVADLLTMPTTP